MKIFVKNLLKETIRLIVLIFVKGRIGRYIESVIINSVVNRCIPIVHKGLSLKFYAPNDLTRSDIFNNRSDILVNAFCVPGPYAVEVTPDSSFNLLL